MDELLETYSNVKEKIEEKYEIFQELWDKGTDEDLFAEMIFCICTPQSSAKAGWKAATKILNDDLFEADEFILQDVLGTSGVRFKKNKVKYIIHNRPKFYPGTKMKLASILAADPMTARDHLVKAVKGWGMKEASHFMRNIGFGDKLCILDRHILRCLVEFEVIDSIPNGIDRATYLQIEEEMKHFSKEVQIPLFALDFVFWAREHKGEIFK
jgi:N-glycosylase/DNA lyase